MKGVDWYKLLEPNRFCGATMACGGQDPTAVAIRWPCGGRPNLGTAEAANDRIAGRDRCTATDWRELLALV